MKAGVAGLSGPLALVLLLPMEAGVPIPVPADLVMFTVGERVAAGKFPLWLAVTGFEVIAVLGTTGWFSGGSGGGSGRRRPEPGWRRAARRASA
jgi:membrane protein DedA with SNARE-associated domain